LSKYYSNTIIIPLGDYYRGKYAWSPRTTHKIQDNDDICIIHWYAWWYFCRVEIHYSYSLYL